MVKKIIAYWGIKTGVGTTLNSILMAKRLKQLGYNVLIWDLNFKNPNIHLYCNSEDNIHNINNLITYISSQSLTQDIVRDNIQTIEVGKGFSLDYLRGISNLSFSITDCVRELDGCYKFLQEMYDYIIIDCANDINNSGTYFALSKADITFLVADRNVITIRQFDFFKQYIKTQFNYKSHYLLLNKVSKEVFIPTEDIEKYLEFDNKEIYEMPYIDNNILLDSINKGELLDFITSNNKIISNIDDSLNFIINQRINSEVEYTKKKGFKFFK